LTRPQSDTPDWVFARLDLPRPLEPSQVDALLLRLAADRAGPTLIFEARAEPRQLFNFLIGIPASHSTWVRRTLRDLVAGMEIDKVPTTEGQGRQPVDRALSVRLRPAHLALATDRAEMTSIALLSALNARRRDDERLIIQLMLGPRQPARHLPEHVADPRDPWWHELFGGDPAEASRPVRQQIEARAGQHGFAAALRIGVSAATPERRKQLVTGVLGAMSTAVDRGVYLDLDFIRSDEINIPAVPRRWPLTLGATEITGLLAWPFGERDLPGVRPLHPRPLRVPAGVSRTERIFAVPAAEHPGLPVGILDADITGHFIALGPTGSGKSTVMANLVAADARAGRPLVVIDPKRQLIDDLLDCAIPAHRAADVVIIDPAEVSTGRVVGFNPLDIGDRDPDVVVDGLVAVLAAVFHDGWGPRTADLTESTLVTLARVGVERDLPFTLLDVPRMWTDERFRTQLIGRVGDDPGLASFWSWFNQQSPTSQANVIAAPLNKLRRILNRPSLRAILGQPRPVFRLRDVFRTNKIVLVPLNEALIGPITAQLLGSLLVAETWQATLERATEATPTARPASVYIDEVQQYLNLPLAIDDALARSRSLGVGWHLAHQFRSQLPPSTRAGVDSNAKSKVIFRTLDPDDARDMAKQAPDLVAADFMALGRHEAYVNLAVQGTPAGWALVKTLPPPPPTGLGDQLRASSRDHYASSVPDPTSTHDRPEATAGDDDQPLGRKPRQP
jgi:hypothetical protein